MKKIITGITLRADLSEDISSKSQEPYRFLELFISEKRPERVFLPAAALELLELKCQQAAGSKNATFKTHTSSE